MLWALAAVGRRYCVTNFQASRRISIRLLRRASSGASGKDTTKSVVKPNCTTAQHNPPKSAHTFRLGFTQTRSIMAICIELSIEQRKRMGENQRKNGMDIERR